MSNLQTLEPLVDTFKQILGLSQASKIMRRHPTAKQIPFESGSLKATPSLSLLLGFTK
jgi:hypothetical protein